MKLDNPLHHLGDRSAATLQLLLQLPKVKRADSAAEAKEVARRVRLIKRLLAVPEARSKATAPMRKRLRQALAAVWKAVAPRTEALRSFRAAEYAYRKAAQVFDLRASELQQQLYDGADPRINAFVQATAVIRDKVLASKRTVRTNDVLRVLDTATERALSMRILPLSGGEVSLMLMTISNDVRPLLAVLGLNPPEVEPLVAVAATRARCADPRAPA